MTSTAAAVAPPAPLHGGKLALVTVALSFATFMEILDTTIVNVSVPHIAGDLAVAANQGTWAISSYGLAAAIAVPLTGWLAGRFGQVKCFSLSVLLFTLMSILCGMANSLPMLVAFRFLQGLVSGPMVPLSQTLLLSTYPPEKKGLALALWSMTVIVAPIFGPLLGGYITDQISWPWIFYINVPVGIVAGIASWNLLKDRETPTRKLPIDVVGLILLVLGVGSLQVMLDNGNDLDWFNSPIIVTLCAVAVLALTYFVAWELTEEHPIVELTLLKRRNFTIGVIVLSLGMFCFFGSTVLFPLWLQTVMGYNSTWAGVATAPGGVLALFLSPIIGKNITKLNLRMVASIAFVVFGITMFWYASFTLDTDLNHIMLSRFMQGIGIACFFVPLNQIILSGLGPAQMASASGLSNFFRTISGSFATAIAVFLWDRRQNFSHVRLTENVNAANPASVDYLSKLQDLGLSAQAAYAQVDQVIAQQSFMIATKEVFWLLGVIFFALIVIVWFAKPPFGSTGGGGGGH
ncbi:DHA2 family efflux MFS transporter permease subunit [Amantichitinum ursilacus]|uniref:Multidrug export protein EmrB n=1 Tax=Amantichitinum ursilacus TaxID=857265 RepID=A0A0N0GN43_9NEIS|nr:DHA2 family efflux MFS transporter permease subunit [Amantichitinum ursilacus]KPC52110.1 Multidrug export protein EmrB [Amantichitinum ursilacus]